jgi:hypothetical protein
MKEKNTWVKSVRIFTADWKDRFKIQSDQFGFLAYASTVQQLPMFIVD